MTGVDFKRDQIQIFATTGAVTRGEIMIIPINMLSVADVFLDSIAKTEFRAIGTLALRRRAPSPTISNTVQQRPANAPNATHSIARFIADGRD